VERSKHVGSGWNAPNPGESLIIPPSTFDLPWVHPTVKREPVNIEVNTGAKGLRNLGEPRARLAAATASGALVKITPRKIRKYRNSFHILTARCSSP
jgi:hypothetical protein